MRHSPARPLVAAPAGLAARPHGHRRPPGRGSAARRRLRRRRQPQLTRRYRGPAGRPARTPSPRRRRGLRLLARPAAGCAAWSAAAWSRSCRSVAAAEAAPTSTPQRAALAQGRAVVVFPEGTRSRDGAARCDSIAAPSGWLSGAAVPVVPVGLHRHPRRLLPAHGDFARSAVTVRFGSPLADRRRGPGPRGRATCPAGRPDARLDPAPARGRPGRLPRGLAWSPDGLRPRRSRGRSCPRCSSACSSWPRLGGRPCWRPPLSSPAPAAAVAGPAARRRRLALPPAVGDPPDAGRGRAERSPPKGAAARATPTDVRDPAEGLCRGRRPGARRHRRPLPGHTVEGRGLRMVVVLGRRRRWSERWAVAGAATTRSSSPTPCCSSPSAWPPPSRPGPDPQSARPTRPIRRITTQAGEPCRHADSPPTAHPTPAVPQTHRLPGALRALLYLLGGAAVVWLAIIGFCLIYELSRPGVHFG